MQAGWDFRVGEARDGARFSFNVWPTTKLEATRIVAPLACMYTPLKRIEGMPPALGYDPIRCNGCGAVLNPYVQVDHMTKLWTCPFCITRNHFPPHYAENISETNLPAELVPQFTTVEYEMQSMYHGVPPVFLFCVDTCLPEDEIEHLKDSLQQTLALLPEEALVGLITFGTHTHVHELGFSECPKAYVFRGDKEYTTQKVQDMLGIAPPTARGGGPAGMGPQGAAGARTPAIGRFLLPVSEGSFVFETILDGLTRDPWPCKNDERPMRCTGAAMSVALGLLETAVPRHGARLMMLVGGPPTVGPGLVVGRAKTEFMRSHMDLQRNQAPHNKQAIKYYQGLAERAVAMSHTVDIFACSLDQIGLLEMKVCVHNTGGLVVLADSFGQSVFRESFRRVFTRYPEDRPGDAGYLMMGFGASIEVVHSREFKVSGCIGPCSSMKKMGPSVSETAIGVGGTNAWSLGSIDQNTTLAFYFDVHQAQAQMAPNKRRYIQYLTTYQHPNGRIRLRVTTLCGMWHTDSSDVATLGRSFDQEATAGLLARLAVFRTETEDISDVMRWLDRALIRLCSKFATYKKDEPQSFRLPPEFSLFPQFMFHLRRSQFLQVFNSSPDESSYYRYILCRENAANSLIMIQPTLLAYSFHGPPPDRKSVV